MERRAHPTDPVLMVDDESSWLDSFKTVLAVAGITNTITCQDSRQVLSILAEQPISVLLLDMMMPHMTGEDLLPRIMEEHPEQLVIVLSGINQLDTAVRCIKAGAYEYFVKTTEKDKLVTAVRRAIELGEVRAENVKLKKAVLSGQPSHPEAFAQILTRCEKMRGIFAYAEAVSGSSLPVLITGETGTGKELMAQAVHDLSDCAGHFVAVNVAGLDDNMFSDTLFGHRRGAFTGAEERRDGLVAQAAEGTLFLDEIGDLDQSCQVKLLRLLQEREYLPLGADVPEKCRARVVVATQADLDKLQESGVFRKDLYYRLASHRIHLPPLRERLEDVELLLEHFLAEAASEFGKTKPPVPEHLLTRLRNHAFPGNVRELRSMVFDAVAGYSSGWLSIKAFTLEGPATPLSVNREANPFTDLGTLPTARAAYAALVREAMSRSGGNRSAAAEMLGISRQALARHLKGGTD